MKIKIQPTKGSVEFEDIPVEHQIVLVDEVTSKLGPKKAIEALHKDFAGDYSYIPEHFSFKGVYYVTKTLAAYERSQNTVRCNPITAQRTTSGDGVHELTESRYKLLWFWIHLKIKPESGKPLPTNVAFTVEEWIEDLLMETLSARWMGREKTCATAQVTKENTSERQAWLSAEASLVWEKPIEKVKESDSVILRSTSTQVITLNQTVIVKLSRIDALEYRRLHERYNQRSLYGSNTPPEVTMEIQDIEDRLIASLSYDYRSSGKNKEDSENIQKLLVSGFTERKLEQIISSNGKLSPVLNDISWGRGSLQDVVFSIINEFRSSGLLQQLLEVVKSKNEYAYKKYLPYYKM